MKNKIVKLNDVEEKLLESNASGFSTALLFNSYFKYEKELLVNGLLGSEARAEHIGIISFLDHMITKINQIQEERDERE